MPGRQITTTARTISRRLAAVAARERARSPHARAAPPAAQRTEPPQAAEPARAAAPGLHQADDAQLDSLRGELVRELDRLAAADQGCSASFRRI